MSEAPLNHATDAQLRALSLGQLPPEEMARVAAHLAGCAECCRRIDEMTSDDPLLALLKQSVARTEEALVPPGRRRSAVRALRGGQGAQPESQQHLNAVLANFPTPKQVGDYDILAEVGRGGMGVVYKARHRALNRLSALKMVLAGEFASAAQQLRFRLEAELAARIRHPNFVQLYEIGEHDGRTFLAMEWVDGGNLAQQLDGKPWPPRQAAALIETLARAMHVAHGEGVVHRDLKPANILLAAPTGPAPRTPASLTPAPLTPKITDFGLAQATESARTLTRSGVLVGTPGYIAPEQASGNRALVGPATDTYALGVVLYELLTGQLPFPGDSTLEVLRAVVNDEPVRPRRLNPPVPRDLEAVTLHCLEKEPARRYSSALELALDLERFREGRQVTARPVGLPARLVRACRRRPLVTLLVALLAASLFGGLVGVTWKWLEADEQRARAGALARQALDEKREALFQTYCARVAAAVAALSAHDVADAARQLDAAPEDLRGWEWQHLHSRLDDSSSVIAVPDQTATSSLGAAGPLRIAAFVPGGVRVTDLETGAARTVPISREPVEYRRVLAVAETRRGLRLALEIGKSAFDLLDEAGRRLCRVGNYPNAVAVSPDATRLACASNEDGGQLAVFDAASGKKTALCDPHENEIWAYTFSPDGTRLASGGGDQTARLWDPTNGALLATCRGHTSKVLSVAFDHDGKRLVTASSDGTVRQWDTATGRAVEPPYEGHTGEVATAVYSTDGELVASAGSDRTVRVWRATGRQDVAALHGHTGAVFRVEFASDGRRLASSSLHGEIGAPWAADGTVRFWDSSPDSTLPVLRGHTSYVYPVAFSPDGRWIASAGFDKTVRLWDAVTAELCATWPQPGIVRALTFGPDGSWLVAGVDDRLRFLDLATGRIRREIQGPPGFGLNVVVSPDGKRVAATAQTANSRLNIFDVDSGRVLFAAEGAALAYSPDDRWLAVREKDESSVLLRDARTHAVAARFHGHEGRVNSAAFSPDSRRLATCSKDRTIRVWQIDSGACQVLRGHSDEVFAAAFHPDGTRLATAGQDRAIWLWDLARGEAVARLPGHTGYVWSLAFSPDGATLASGSGDFTVRLWDTAPLRTRYRARREAAALRPEAERLVARLWPEKKNDATAVADRSGAERALAPGGPAHRAAAGAAARVVGRRDPRASMSDARNSGDESHPALATTLAGEYISEQVGVVIGPYKLQQKLGEGGMGSVWVADQSEPLKRRVALKLIKVGMDTTYVLRRFEAERQALALMDHQNIAKVLDAGATPQGRPYFAMELIKGIPITKYCDQEHLTPHERLELFTPVCQAVQHAHQKGVIHRDLKPSNVLIALYDGKPVPKIIDFGLAKATSHALTERTLYTEVGQIVGTLEYMAPEQAESNNLDIDTRADIYSLGVILYELLAGSPPFTSKQLQGAGLTEKLRMIREVEPPKPSTRLSSSNALPSIAANRKLEPNRLTRLVHGDLDWIVMKALEKDRARRYETANGFAMDIQRYLADEPVSAGPPGVGYRLRKLARRHRAALGVAGMFVVLLVLAACLSTWQAVRATRAEREALAERDRAEQERNRAEVSFKMARETVDRFFTQVGESPKLKAQGMERFRKDLLVNAKEFYERFIREQFDAPEVRHDLGLAHMRLAKIHEALGDYSAAEALSEKAIEMLGELARAHSEADEYRRDLAASLFQLGAVYSDTGRFGKAEDAYHRALAIQEKLAADHPEAAEYRRAMATTLEASGASDLLADQFVKAQASLEQALTIWGRLVGNDASVPEDRAGLANAQARLGDAYADRGQSEKAEAMLKEAVSTYRALVRDYPEVPEYRRSLADTYDVLGGVYFGNMRQVEKAVATWQQALPIFEKLAQEHPDVLEFSYCVGRCYSNLALAERELGRSDAALTRLDKALEILEHVAGRGHGMARLLLFDVRINRLLVLVGRGEHRRATDEANAVARQERLIAVNLYNIACVFSLSSAAAEKDTRLSPADRTNLKAQYADRAMKFLHEAVANGFQNAAGMKRDPDLTPLRTRADFQKLVQEVELKSKK